MRARLYICNNCLRKPFQKRSTHTSTKSTASNPNSKIPLRDLSPSDLCYYWDTKAPDASQLAYADKFFQPSRHSPIKLWSASKFRTTPLESSNPEVVFLGRSNVGKSSLLNAVMGEEVCWTSSKPGRTREMNAFGIGGTKGGHSKVILLDMPGYGKASRTEWGAEILKYLSERIRLCRAFLLIDGSHGLKETDKDILALFRDYAIPHQIVLSKVDKLLSTSSKQMKSGAAPSKISSLRRTLEQLRPVIQPAGQVGALGEIVTCSAETSLGAGKALGINALRWSILTATGFGGSVEVMKDNTVPGNSSSGTAATA